MTSASPASPARASGAPAAHSLSARSALTPPDDPGAAGIPTFGRLLRTELHRLAARRFVRVIVLLGVVGYLAALGLMWRPYSQVDAADRAQATVARDAELTHEQAFQRQCIAQAPDDTAKLNCGQPPTAAEMPADNFFKNRPFQPSAVGDYALAVGSVISLIAFVVGASFIGAEWSAKNLVAWLFWEPRRLRLLAAKMLALLAVALALSTLGQLVFAVTARLLLHYRGEPVSTLTPSDPHFWTSVAHTQIRAALLVVPAALLGLGLANLMRHTAAAFGVAFVYLAIVETAIRQIWPSWQPYLLLTSINA